MDTNQPAEVPSAEVPPAEAPPAEVPAEVPPAEVPAAVPPAEVPAEVPPAEVPAEVPPAEVPAEVPPAEVPAAEVPPAEVPAAEVPSAQVTDYVFNCPHCQMLVQVPRDGLNCQIFRHGVLKSNPDVQIPPHASQAECEQFIAAGLIYGCGRPFIYRGGAAAEICGYI
jgi:hypothetical protein